METNAKKMVGKQVVRCLAKGGVEQVVAEVFSTGTKFTFDNLGKSWSCSNLFLENPTELLNKGVSFYRNCGAASMGKYNRVIKFYQLS